MRFLGLGLLAALVVSALSAGAAMASKFNVNTYTQYKHCPYENPEVIECFTGITNGGSKGGYFQIGKVLTKLNKPITLQGGLAAGSNSSFGRVVPATNGGLTLESGEETVVGGLGVITKEIQNTAEWPQALKESFKAAKENKEGKVKVIVEVAGNSLYEDGEGVSPEHILFEEGIAFKLPLKVRLVNPWLEKLGGGPCLVGNDEHPVKQNLTTEGLGAAGSFSFNEDFSAVEIANSTLVDVGWHVEEGSQASGCGGPEYESFVDRALNIALAIPSSTKTGITVLEGTLFDAAVGVVKQKGEKGEL